MSQTVVNDVHAPAFEGLLLGAWPHAIVTGLANEAGPLHLPVGRLAVKLATDAVDQVSLPAVATDISAVGRVQGVVMADTTVETDPAVAFGHVKQDDTASLVRKGRLWVLVEDAILDLDQGVYVRHAAAGPLTPDTFGTFAAAASANHTILAAAAWKSLAGAGELALLEINLP